MSVTWSTYCSKTKRLSAYKVILIGTVRYLPLHLKFSMLAGSI